LSRIDEPDNGVLDVRTYKLVGGGGESFDRLFRECALPMLHRYRIQVVAYGASLADDDQYFLMRAFASSASRDEQLESFYGSDEWRQTYREAALALIETYHVVVVELTPSLRGAISLYTER